MTDYVLTNKSTHEVATETTAPVEAQELSITEMYDKVTAFALLVMRELQRNHAELYQIHRHDSEAALGQLLTHYNEWSSTSAHFAPGALLLGGCLVNKAAVETLAPLLNPLGHSLQTLTSTGEQGRRLGPQNLLERHKQMLSNVQGFDDKTQRTLEAFIQQLGQIFATKHNSVLTIAQDR